MKKLCAVALILALLFPSCAFAINALAYMELYRERLNEYNDSRPYASPINPFPCEPGEGVRVYRDGDRKAYSFSAGLIYVNNDDLAVSEVCVFVDISFHDSPDSTDYGMAVAALTAMEKMPGELNEYQSNRQYGPKTVDKSSPTFWVDNELKRICEDVKADKKAYSDEVTVFTGKRSKWTVKVKKDTMYITAYPIN